MTTKTQKAPLTAPVQESIMRLCRYFLAALALGGLLTGSEVHADRGTKREAINLVQQALRHIETAGLEQALKDFKQPDANPFRHHDLYVFVYDYDRFDAGKMMDIMGKYEVSTFCAPPTIFRFMIKSDMSG